MPPPYGIRVCVSLFGEASPFGGFEGKERHNLSGFEGETERNKHHLGWFEGETEKKKMEPLCEKGKPKGKAATLAFPTNPYAFWPSFGASGFRPGAAFLVRGSSHAGLGPVGCKKCGSLRVSNTTK